MARPNRRDGAMLWAVACMCLFGFLWAGEVVIPSDSIFDPSAHLAYGDVQVDNVASPQYLQVWIKASKTNPFCLGVSVFLGVTGSALCPVMITSILDYMVWRGPLLDLSSSTRTTRSSPVTASSQQCGLPWNWLGLTHPLIRATASISARPPRLPSGVSQTPSSRPWAGGKMWLILFKFELVGTPCALWLDDLSPLWRTVTSLFFVFVFFSSGLTWLDVLFSLPFLPLLFVHVVAAVILIDSCGPVPLATIVGCMGLS